MGEASPTLGAGLEVVGGLGLFLLGMVVMTDALRALAGSSLTRALARFTRSPLTGVLSGASATAVVQSSSATTLTAVGFAGAGLLTFAQALGIVFGANIGTTVTGWLVALLGFKLKIGSLALPLIPLGMVLRLFGRGRMAPTGLALAGFGLIFVGIGVLQQGMEGFQGFVVPEQFPADTLGGRALLVGIGIAITLVTQSSSAGVAAALAAVAAGAISLPQALAMVIGMDVGTTATAWIATLGGSLAARRTGVAHVVYNLFTGATAFVLVSPYLTLVDTLLPGATTSDPELVLVAFHSSYNVACACIAVPFAGQFARLIEGLVRERPSPFARRLDRALLAEPELAVAAVSATLTDLAGKSFDALERELRGESAESQRPRLDLVALALAETRRYLERTHVPADRIDAYRRQVSALHAVDHLDRLVDRARRWNPAPGTSEPQLKRIARALATALRGAQEDDGSDDEIENVLEALWDGLEDDDADYRAEVLGRSARGEFDTRSGLEQLDAYRWLRRTAYHAWRIVHHVRRSRYASAPVEAETMAPAAEPDPSD